MSSLSFIGAGIGSIYLQTGLALSVAGLLFCFGFDFLFEKKPLGLRLGGFKSWVHLGYGAILFSLLLPWGLNQIPQENLLRPRVQVYSGSVFSSKNQVEFRPVFSNLSGARSSPVFRFSSQWVWMFWFIVLGVVSILSARFIFRLIRFRRYLQSLYLLRKIGRAKILVSETDPVAFSTWISGQALVVLPLTLLSAGGNYGRGKTNQDLNYTLQHELQHHRSGDTRVLYFLEIIKILFFWSPGFYLLIKKISLIQEFACDEALIGRQRNRSQAYSSCLVRAAETSLQSSLHWAGTTSMAVAGHSHVLKRRVQMILSMKTARPTRKVLPGFVLALVCLVTTIGYAAKSTIQANELTLEQAQKLVPPAGSSEIPIEVNSQVLSYLNYFINTQKGRTFMKEGKARMVEHKEMIETFLGQNRFPKELVALAFFESGFENKPPTPPQRGAGIWEFIEATAKRYKMVVTPERDDRLNVKRETQAAMDYLSDLKDLFGDWRLVIKAYNEGEAHVQALIQRLGTKDPWVLEKEPGSEGELPGVIAVMILLAHPELLNT